MVARRISVRHNVTDYDIDYDTDDGFEVLKFQIFSLTSVPPDEQKILARENDSIVSDVSDLVAISDKLRLVSINDDEANRAGISADHITQMEKSDEELARLLQAEEEALMYQQFAASEHGEKMEQRIRPYIDQVQMYEDPARQEAARKTVPVEKLEEKALVALAKEGNFEPKKSEQDHAFLLQLLFWFKQSFRWVNAPSCDSCGNETENKGMGTPLLSEIRYGASRVEVYSCFGCSSITRFPRYNDPMKLLETRQGRCGEWANCFTLYCRSFGYESRLILDFTDHVWTECFSHSLGRWMHLDPCEAIYDRPLLYENGWSKKLNYVIALANDGVYDVTRRYTRKWNEVSLRRNLTTEPALTALLSRLRQECRQKFLSKVVTTLEERDRKEAEALEKDFRSTDISSISLPGRQSGDESWRMSRSEFGSDSLSSSLCPVRRCIDEHVTRIYDALSIVICHFVEACYPKSKAIEVLNIFRKAMINLKNSPFKQRTTSINSGAEKYFLQMLPYFGKLLDALSLKSSTSDPDGRIEITLAGAPVKTSIALPVFFHAVDDVIQKISNCSSFSEKASLSWPMLKRNRICSGLVLASGEELPFGIATCTFDGTRMSKWEEPNGAKGCWITYKVKDNKKYKLVAYELMSANDAPERDPMDWIVEGSDDGGCSWQIMDKQASQTFENRFQRKAFEIKKSATLLANAFRFRFLAVADSKSNQRFQIGSIDLFAEE
ncbi:peptide-N(4)-(N-acetyl-beta-glucosaminyl)asparagine amidase [Impatiens glandulifera]|uniref:peptide-N(4)-(N-acetyl-beta- glucosaminyl)asparagine amidase n=1 Tax=Impatiens glandulifera TaxID=253017 RepID=UPI001FB144C5|nr:peptide-N(4)-(N-acetyl-beta-glucosaminyl)asparagine amidase [Impatiens glandulifera]